MSINYNPEQEKNTAQIKAFNALDKASVATINEYTSSYNFYKKLPIILFWAIVSIGCLGGIISGIVLDSFGAFILPVISSLISGGLTYFLTKVSCAERILNLEYTKRAFYTLKINQLEEKLKNLEEQEKSTKE